MRCLARRTADVADDRRIEMGKIMNTSRLTMAAGPVRATRSAHRRVCGSRALCALPWNHWRWCRSDGRVLNRIRETIARPIWFTDAGGRSLLTPIERLLSKDSGTAMPRSSFCRLGGRKLVDYVKYLAIRERWSEACSTRRRTGR